MGGLAVSGGLLAGSTILSLIKVAGVTIVVGQGLKLIGKKEFKALVDFCGVTSFLLIVGECFVRYFNNLKNTAPMELAKPILKGLGDLIKFVMQG